MRFRCAISLLLHVLFSPFLRCTSHFIYCTTCHFMWPVNIYSLVHVSSYACLLQHTHAAADSTPSCRGNVCVYVTAKWLHACAALCVYIKVCCTCDVKRVILWLFVACELAFLADDFRNFLLLAFLQLATCMFFIVIATILIVFVAVVTAAAIACRNWQFGALMMRLADVAVAVVLKAPCCNNQARERQQLALLYNINVVGLTTLKIAIVLLYAMLQRTKKKAKKKVGKFFLISRLVALVASYTYVHTYTHFLRLVAFCGNCR